MANQFLGTRKEKRGAPWAMCPFWVPQAAKFLLTPEKKKEVPWAICPFWVPQVLQVSLQVSLVDG